VRYALVLMGLGAAASLGSAIAALATKDAVRNAMEHARKHPSGDLLTTAVNTTVAMSAVAGLVGVALWLIVAGGSWKGNEWARTTGSVLFGLDTLDLLIGPAGLRAVGSNVTRALSGIIWLIGLSVIVLLWQRSSTAFFKAD
jgi:hypothetical protein